MPKPVVAAICYRRKSDKIEFLLVRTKSGKQWTFPKGHVEPDPPEMPWDAARREAYEEAGIFGSIEKEPFTHYTYYKGKKNHEDKVAAYLMSVQSESNPIEPDRNPHWFTPEQTIEKLAVNRPEKKYRLEHERIVKEALARLS